VLLGASLLVAWDLLLDPAMSKVTSYWVWGETGSYYDMPWMNLVGWGITGLVLFIILNKMAPDPKSSPRFAFWVYLVNFALPLGFCILNRYWLAVLAGPSSIALAWFVFCARVAQRIDQAGFSDNFRRHRQRRAVAPRMKQLQFGDALSVEVK